MINLNNVINGPDYCYLNFFVENAYHLDKVYDDLIYLIGPVIDIIDNEVKIQIKSKTIKCKFDLIFTEPEKKKLLGNIVKIEGKLEKVWFSVIWLHKCNFCRL